MVIAPILHVVPGALAERLAAYAATNHPVTTYFSGTSTRTTSTGS